MQKQANKRFGCGICSLIGPIKGEPGKFGYACLFCGSLRCDRCRKPKLKKLRQRLDEITAKYKLTKMLTLTLDPKKLAKGEASDRYIRNCWRSMRVLLAKKLGKSVDFFCVLEFQKKTGMAHLHVLTNQYIEFEWIKKKWEKIGGGEHVDIRHIDVHRAVAYLTPYLAGDKIVHTLERLPKRARIFTTSRSIVLWGKGKKKNSGWWLRRESIGALYDAAPNPSAEQSVPDEALKRFGLELLSFFKAMPTQEAIGDRDGFEVLKAAVTVWKDKA